MSNRTFLGKVGMTPKGEWNNSTTYERLDVVSYEGSSYIALAQNRNSIPTESNPNWMIGAKHGEFTEEQLEEFKEAVVAESKQEMDDYTAGKKTELDTYEGQKESELNTYTTTKKEEIDTHTAGKINDYNTNADTKTRAFNTNAETKTTNFNDNTTSKTNAYNQNAEDKTTVFNTNAANKQTAFDNNATQKTTAFNENATSKTTDFNTNATNKKQDFDDNAEDKTEAFDQNAADKTAEFDTHTIELEQEIADLRAASYKIYTETPSTNVTLNKTSKNKFIKFGVNGNREQQTYEGRNLKDFSIITYTSINNATISRNGGTYTIANSSSQYGAATIRQSELQLNPNTTYTLSTKVVTTNANAGSSVMVSAGLIDTDTNTYGNKATSGNITSITFTTPSEIPDNAYIGLYPREADKTAVFGDIQLEKGSTATDYEPYTYGQAPNPSYECPISSVGDDINLFDKDNANVINAYINTTNKTILPNANSKTAYISVKPKTTYTISKIAGQRFSVVSTENEPANNVIGTNLIYDFTATELTITTGENDKYLAVFYYLSTVDTLTEEEIRNSIKIQEGSIATPYSPYGIGNVNVVKCNKNWFDKTATPTTPSNVARAIILPTGVRVELTYASNNNLIRYLIMDLKGHEGETVKVKANVKSSASNPGFMYLRTSKSNTDYNPKESPTMSGTTLNGTLEITYTVPSVLDKEYHYLSLALYGTRETLANVGDYVDYNNLQVEINNVATPFILHEEEVFNIPCQKPMVDAENYFFKNTKDSEYYDNTLAENKWYYHEEFELLDLTADIFNSFTAVTQGNLFRTSVITKGTSKNYTTKSNYYTGVASASNRDNYKIYWNPTIKTFDLIDNRFDNLNDYKEWVNTVDLKALLLLETPTNTECTQAQVEVLEAIEDSTSYYEQTNGYSNDPVSPILDITAVGDQNLVIDEIVAMQIALGGEINNG